MPESLSLNNTKAQNYSMTGSSSSQLTPESPIPLVALGAVLLNSRIGKFFAKTIVGTASSIFSFIYSPKNANETENIEATIDKVKKSELTNRDKKVEALAHTGEVLAILKESGISPHINGSEHTKAELVQQQKTTLIKGNIK